MRHLSGLAYAITLSMSLAACGGGGGGGSSTPPVPPPPPPPPGVTLSATSQSADVVEGQTETSLSFTALQSGSATTPIYPDVQYDTGLLTLDGSLTTPTPGQFSAKFKTKGDLGGGEYAGQITFRLCQDVACTVVYPNTTKVFDYKVTVNLKGWLTHQREAGHSGYVRVNLDPSKFASGWEWRASTPSYISAAVASDGVVYFSRQNKRSNGVAPSNDDVMSVFALNETDGSLRWRYRDNLYQHSYGAPSLDANRVYISAVNYFQEGAIWSLYRSTGEIFQKFYFDSGFVNHYSPTTYDGQAFTYGGKTGNAVYGFTPGTNAGYSQWTIATPHSPNGSSIIAADDTSVYFHSGRGLSVARRSNGSLIHEIEDTVFADNGPDYDASPMLLSKTSVVAYSGTTMLNNTLGIEGGHQRHLVNYDVLNGKVVWISEKTYKTVPAFANGVIYAARNGASSLDAIDARTGAILWSWEPPTGQTFIRNTIATDNLLFVSTDKNTYAIDIATRTAIWSYPVGGALSLSPGYILYIAEDASFNFGGLIGSRQSSTGTLVAIRLK